MTGRCPYLAWRASAEEPAEPAAPVVPADVIYQGVGDSIVPITLPDGAGQIAIATISHVGSSNFAIWSLDAGMAQQDLLVNTIGGYNGTVMVVNEIGAYTGTTRWTAGPSVIVVTADGSWSIAVGWRMRWARLLGEPTADVAAIEPAVFSAG